MRKHTAYAIGKYGNAYYSLAVGPDEIHARLINAAYELTPITEDMVPDEVSADVKWINDQFSKKDTIEKSIKGRHLTTCVTIAKRIVCVYHKLNELNDKLNDSDYKSENQEQIPININIKF